MDHVVKVKLFCPGVFSEATAVCSSSPLNVVSVSMWLNKELRRMNSGEEMPVVKIRNLRSNEVEVL